MWVDTRRSGRLASGKKRLSRGPGVELWDIAELDEEVEVNGDETSEVGSVVWTPVQDEIWCDDASSVYDDEDVGRVVDESETAEQSPEAHQASNEDEEHTEDNVD